MIEEFKDAGNGLKNVWDAGAKEDITCRAYLTVVGADMPAKGKTTRNA